MRARQIEFEKLIKCDLVGLDNSVAMTQLLAQAAIREPLRLRVQVHSFEAVCKSVQAGMLP